MPGRAIYTELKNYAQKERQSKSRYTKFQLGPCINKNTFYYKLLLYSTCYTVDDLFQDLL